MRDLPAAPMRPNRAGSVHDGRGATVWFTGLPASGKSTAAATLANLLEESGVRCCILDGDALRTGLCSDLDFSVSGRQENVRRVLEVALIAAQSGLVSLVSLVSPFAEGRARARARHEEQGIPFLEVLVSTPARECERRDPKGLYSRARRGELQDLTGLDDPYEIPSHPDVTIDGSTSTDASDAAKVILDELLSLWTPPPRGIVVSELALSDKGNPQG